MEILNDGEHLGRSSGREALDLYDGIADCDNDSKKYQEKRRVGRGKYQK